MCPVEEMAFVVCSLAALFTVRVRNDPLECLNKLLWTLLCSFIAPFTRQRWLQLPVSLDDSLGDWPSLPEAGEQKGVLNFLFIIIEDGQRGASSAERGHQGG